MPVNAADTRSRAAKEFIGRRHPSTNPRRTLTPGLGQHRSLAVDMQSRKKVGYCNQDKFGYTILFIITKCLVGLYIYQMFWWLSPNFWLLQPNIFKGVHNSVKC